MKKIDYKELEIKASQFCAWLKEEHCGIENAIKFRQMGGMWGDHRTVRYIVHHLRVNGYPICSGNDGYYYAKSREEVEGVMKYLMSFITNYQEAFDGLNKSLTENF